MLNFNVHKAKVFILTMSEIETIATLALLNDTVTEELSKVVL